MEVQAIAQGTCTECDTSDDNYTEQSRSHHFNPLEDEDEEPTYISRSIKCNCGATASVTISAEGVETDGPISHEEASWNEE